MELTWSKSLLWLWFYCFFRLSGCNLTERCCEQLSSAISSSSSTLTELDLCQNDLKDSGVNQLCAGLGSPDSKLTALRSVFRNLLNRKILIYLLRYIWSWPDLNHYCDCDSIVSSGWVAVTSQRDVVSSYQFSSPAAPVWQNWISVKIISTILE